MAWRERFRNCVQAQNENQRLNEETLAVCPRYKGRLPLGLPSYDRRTLEKAACSILARQRRDQRAQAAWVSARLTVLRHLVQTFSLCLRPWYTIVRFVMFGKKRRLTACFEWLTLWPYIGLLPQISHRCAIPDPSPFKIKAPTRGDDYHSTFTRITQIERGWGE